MKSMNKSWAHESLMGRNKFQSGVEADWRPAKESPGRSDEWEWRPEAFVGLHDFTILSSDIFSEFRSEFRN